MAEVQTSDDGAISPADKTPPKVVLGMAAHIAATRKAEKLTCQCDIHMGFFFDGFGRSKDLDDPTSSRYSNISRLWEAYRDNNDRRRKNTPNEFWYPFYYSGLGTPLNDDAASNAIVSGALKVATNTGKAVMDKAKSTAKEATGVDKLDGVAKLASPTKIGTKVQERFAEPIRKMILEEPSFGYRTVAGLLGFNKNTVQRIFQIKGWQVKKRPIGFRPRVKALPSVATGPDQRWATDLCRIWTGRDGWAVLALVIDCHTRELLGWHLSRSGKSKTAESALEQALIARYGSLGRVTAPFLLRSDNGLVFTSRSYTALVRSYGLQQEFITPHCPQQNGMVERVIRTLKEQCAHRHRFETLQHASRIIGDWIGFYNHRRPHQALGMKTPAEAFALAA